LGTPHSLVNTWGAHGGGSALPGLYMYVDEKGADVDDLQGEGAALIVPRKC
jgi:hypothetical protein